MATTFTAEVKGYEKVVAEYNKVQKEVTKLREEIKRLNDGTAQTGESHKKAGESARKHFDIMAMGRKEIMGLVGSYTGVAGAAQLVGSMMKFAGEETRKAVDSMKGLQPAEGQLAQIAKSTDDLAAMSADADRLAAKYGVKREATRGAIVEGRNFGIDPAAIESMVKYSDIVGTAAQTTVAGKIPSIFGADKISAEEAVSVGLVSAGASAANFEQMATGLPKLAEGGRAAGATPAESMASLSVFAGQFASADTAADRLKALGGKLGRNEATKGKGFIGGVEAMMGMSEAEREGIYGQDMESRAAYQTFVAQMPAIKQQTAAGEKELATMRGGGVSFIEQQYRQKFDPSMAKTDLGRQYVQTQLAMEEGRKAEIAREIANEGQLASRGIGQQVSRDTVLAELKGRGASTNTQMVAERFAGMAEGAGFGGALSGISARGSAAAYESLPMQALGAGTGPLSPVVNLLSGIYNEARNRPRSGSTAMNAATLSGQQQR